MNAVKLLPMTDESLEEMKRSTHDDEILRQLKTVIQTGWPEDKHLLPFVLAPYFSYRDELSVYDGLVLKDECLIILQQMRQKIKNAYTAPILALTVA